MQIVEQVASPKIVPTLGIGIGKIGSSLESLVRTLRMLFFTGSLGIRQAERS